jgi:hypothetical protein
METYGGKSNVSKIKIYGFPGKVLITKLKKNHGESLLVPIKRIFLVFPCDNSNVSYREKRGTLWPVSRRVKSKETLVVFPNLVWVL